MTNTGLYSIVLINLFVMALMDIKCGYVHVWLVLLGSMAAIMSRMLCHQDMGVSLAGAVLGVCTLILCKLTKQSIGYGDGLVVLFLGISLGWQMALTVLMLSLFMISVAGLSMMAVGKVKKKTKWPMIPWILVSFVIEMTMVSLSL